MGQPEGPAGPGEASYVRLAESGPDTETQAGAILGTPSYMAPESASGLTALIDQRSDVYLLGATLYEILTGQRPRTAKTALEMVKLAQHEPPIPAAKLKADVPKALDAICTKAMAHRKEDRYATRTTWRTISSASSPVSPSRPIPSVCRHGHGAGPGGTARSCGGRRGRCSSSASRSWASPGSVRSSASVPGRKAWPIGCKRRTRTVATCGSSAGLADLARYLRGHDRSRRGKRALFRPAAGRGQGPRRPRTRRQVGPGPRTTVAARRDRSSQTSSPRSAPLDGSGQEPARDPAGRGAGDARPPGPCGLAGPIVPELFPPACPRRAATRRLSPGGRGRAAGRRPAGCSRPRSITFFEVRATGKTRTRRQEERSERPAWQPEPERMEEGHRSVPPGLEDRP